MSNSIKVGKKIIGEKKPCFIVAEISANHNGKFADAAIASLQQLKNLVLMLLKFNDGCNTIN